MNILLINVGSSSLKARMDDTLFHRAGLRTPHDHDHALQEMRTQFPEVDYAVHRIVHGDGHTRTAYYDPEIEKRIERGCIAAPLHNIPQLNALRKLPYRHICVFDSLSYDLDEKTYPVPGAPARVGFHGLSHTSMRRAYSGKNLITIHLGSGCSVTAYRGERGVYTSMGYTPLDGVIMGTRPGRIDPGAVLALVRAHGIEKTERILNHESGLLFIAGTADFKTILEQRAQGNRYDDAYRAFVRSVQREILAAYLHAPAKTFVFSGEIGYQSAQTRRDIMKSIPLIVRVKIHKTDEEAVMLDEAKRLIRERRSPPPSRGARPTESSHRSRTTRTGSSRRPSA